MSRTHIGRSIPRIGLVGVLVAAAATILTTSASAASAGLVITEAYGGGGNGGATYSNDFIELQNRGTTAIDLTGRSVQYTSSSGTGSWAVTPLSGSVAPGAYFVIAEAAGANAGTPVPAQNSGTIAIDHLPSRATYATNE